MIYLNSNQTTTSSQSVTLAINSFTKSGNDFSKWAVLSVDGVQWEEGAIYTPSFAYDSENFGVTMYAIWNPETYTITYDANGGSGAPTLQTKNYGVDLILSSVRPTRSDYNFLGWSTSSTANTPTYAAGGTYSINASVTLYAVWGVSGFIEEVLMVNAISDKDIDFSIPSSTSGTNGVFYVESTKNDANPIYYYRGNVDNNLIFANYCWKIIRTTETGGLKLIYNGTPTGGTCNNTGTDTQIGTIAFNSNYNSPAYVGYMYGTPYTYSSKSMSSDTTNYVYGNTVTYAGGTYTLSSTISNSSWSSIYNGGLNNNHYTCFTTGTTCTSVYYVYYTTSSMVYYITLTEGKTVGDALSEMLDYNTTSSAIKGNSTTEGTLDYWYYNNIEQTGYGGYVEDTVWCNDRSIDSLNGWDPNGGNTREFLYFSGKNRSTSTYEPSLICGREIDRFTVNESNGNGDLDYPVGLLTSDEIMLAGGKYSAGNKLYYLYSGGQYWSGSPYNFSDDDAYGFYINATGFLNESYVNNKFRGVRPSISLAAGFNIGGGTGTTSSPYIVQ